jgi:hypothetical protein
MGVTVHYFAFDPGVHTMTPTLDRWLASGAIDRELEVQPAARTTLKEISTWLGDNKRWYDNLAGDHAWSCARTQVDGSARAEIDRWLSHLFWDAGGEGCACGREPIVVAEQEVVFDRALLDHIVSLECSLVPVAPALSLEFDGDPPKTERLHNAWIYDFDGFEGLVSEWQRIFRCALEAGPGWSLLRWVWF